MVQFVCMTRSDASEVNISNISMPYYERTAKLKKFCENIYCNQIKTIISRDKNIICNYGTMLKEHDLHKIQDELQKKRRH